MDLQALNSDLPKPWLNIKANSIMTIGTYSIPTFTQIIVTPKTLTSAEFVNALIHDIVGTGTVNLPVATALTAYLETKFEDGKVPEGFVFETNMYKSTNQNITVNLGAGTTTYGGAASINFPSLNSSTQLNLKYRYSLGTYTVFYGIPPGV